MAFDLKGFTKTKFKARTMAVPVISEALCSFFQETDKKEFTIKGLNGEEMGRCETADKRIKTLLKSFNAVVSGDFTDDSVKELLSLGGDDVNADVARRIEILCLGCTKPKLDIQAAAKITRVAPVDAKNITNHILALSGQGMIPGGPQPSGEGQTSGEVVPSDTPGGNVCTNSDQMCSGKDT